MLSLNGPLYRICNMIYKYLVLNLLFLVFSVPIITFPASSAALFAVVRKEAYHEESSLIRTFWKGFRDNWRQATIVDFLFSLIGWIWWGDIHTLMKSRVPLGSAVSIAMFIVAIVLLSILIHVFPLMVHVHSTTKQLLINALKLTMIKPHLTFVNLISIIALLLLSARFTELFVLCFFSLTATLTYRLVNLKFERVGAVYQNLSIEEDQSPVPNEPSGR